MKKLRRLLFVKNIRQKALAEYAGCSEAYISMCIRGKKTMSPRVLGKIAEYLGVKGINLKEG